MKALRSIALYVLLAACGSGEMSDSPLLTSMPTVGEMIEQFGTTPAELEDIRFIADEEGWSLEEALYRIGWQEAFSLFVDELRKTYPEDFSAGGISRDEGPRNVFLTFRGPIPEDVGSDPRLDHLDVEFRETTGFSEAELSAQVIDVHHTMLDLGFTEVGTGPETETGEVRVDVARRPVDRGKTDAEVIATFPANLRADNVAIVLHPEGTVLGGDD